MKLSSMNFIRAIWAGAFPRRRSGLTITINEIAAGRGKTFVQISLKIMHFGQGIVDHLVGKGVAGVGQDAKISMAFAQNGCATTAWLWYCKSVTRLLYDP